MNFARQILKALKESKAKETKSIDTQAEVKRVEGDTLWVHIPGGVDETPVKKTVNAEEGDQVQVRIAGGRAWVTGNGTAPPTNDKKAVAAQLLAEGAKEMAEAAGEAANQATEDARRAHDAADSAEQSANTATEAANGALSSLSVIEDVMGVLDWVTKHGSYTLTQDTTIIPGKFYFTRSGSGTAQDPYLYTVVSSPDPAQLPNYYELANVDEAVAAFITSHLAMTNEGLWVFSDISKFKTLITNNSMKIYDALGVQVAQFAAETVIGKESEWHQRINGEMTIFAYGNRTYTYIEPGKVHSDNMEVESSYYTGNYSLRAASDGKLVIGRRR